MITSRLLVILISLILISHGLPLELGGVGRRRALVGGVGRRRALVVGLFVVAWPTQGLAAASSTSTPAPSKPPQVVIGSDDPKFNQFKAKLLTLPLLLDELQICVFQEKFDEVKTFPKRIREYIPLLVQFIDYTTTGPGRLNLGDGVHGVKGLTEADLALINTSLGASLRYEVGKMFASVERMSRAADQADGEEVCNAFGVVLLHTDRFLKAGGLYPFYASRVSNEIFYKGLEKDLVFEQDGQAGKKSKLNLKDLVLVVKGENMGRTGTLVAEVGDKGNKIVKLDSLGRFMGPVREVIVVDGDSIKRRVGEQPPDQVFMKASTTKAKQRKRSL
ncbi:hypothetical protein TrVE_jg14225 [Triparma verrucosa]|uniref:Uncharacterized protein n=1 Tax=Triparma verrucosa TaxID=1606542 RepID=A0A9W7EPQ5_9STRA|nr:hypothetical protein TrVE_jg14225 [Triparma verrucosa]